MTRNPAKLAGPNPMPAPREIRVFTPAELKAVTAELGTVESAAVTFAAATGLRPSEWASIERRDVDKGARWSSCREPRRPGHGARCRSRRRRSGRLTRFPRGWTAATCSRHPVSAQGRANPGPFDVANFRRREWGRRSKPPGSRSRHALRPRSTFASNALAAGITMFELARIMGTSAKMIEQHYGTLIDTAHGAILSRLEGFGA